MIATGLSQGSGTSAARRYAGTMAGLWSGLASTLHGLDALAVDSRRLDEETVDTLRLLQYRLHWASEALAGVEPPALTLELHEDLSDALVDAREWTGDVAAALERHGRAGAEEFLLGWRGALFRVRLAQMRLSSTSPDEAEPAAGVPWSAAAATLCTFVGVAAFAAGALIVAWPLWAAGLALVAGGTLLYRGPR